MPSSSESATGALHEPPGSRLAARMIALVQPDALDEWRTLDQTATASPLAPTATSGSQPPSSPATVSVIGELQEPPAGRVDACVSRYGPFAVQTATALP